MNFTERSPIEAGFGPIFQAEVRPKLMALEEDRKVHLKKAYRNVAIALAVGAALVLAIIAIWGSDAMFGFFFVAILTAILALMGWSKESTGWTSAVETAVMPAICQHVGDLDYDSGGGSFPVGKMRALRLLPSYDSVSLTDKLSGAHHGTGFEMVQATLTSKSRDSDGNRTSSTVFSGLLFRIEVPVEIPGRILLMRDRGGFGNKLAEAFSFGSARSMPKVRFDHAAFEAAFEVYADYPDEAKGFMPDAFLDALLQIGAEQGGKKGAKAFVAGFEERSFYMALKRGGAFMKMGSLTTPVADMEESLHAIFDDIALAHQVIDRLHGL